MSAPACIYPLSFKTTERGLEQDPEQVLHSIRILFMAFDMIAFDDPGKEGI